MSVRDDSDCRAGLGKGRTNTLIKDGEKVIQFKAFFKS